MAVVLALPHLFDAVVARFAADGTIARNVFGWRESAQQNATGRRIAWIPGDAAGSLGEASGPRHPGGNPRPLIMLAELVTCEISAVDATALENERAQYQAVRELFDAWLRAVHLAAHGTYSVISSGWITDKKERRYGAAIRAVLAVQAVIPDQTYPSSPVDTSAALTVDTLDATETLTVTAGTE